MMNKLTEPCIFVDEISNISINRSYFKNINKNFSFPSNVSVKPTKLYGRNLVLISSEPVIQL